MANPSVQLTVHVAAPRERPAAWRSWLEESAGQATVVETPLAAAQLSRWLGRWGRATPAVVAWETRAADIPLWSAVLAPALAAALPAISPYQAAPGAAAAVLSAVRIAHDRGVPLARLEDLDPALSEAMAAGWRLWDRVGWGGVAALAAGVPPEGPLAVYGAVDAARDWVLGQARRRPVQVFLASLGARRAPTPPLEWWARQGARVDDARPERAAADREPLRVGVRHPDDSRWAVDSALRSVPGGDVLVVAPPGQAEALARDLRGLGWRAAAHPASPAPLGEWAAWEASVEQPPAPALMEWVRRLPQASAVADAEQVFKHLGHPDRWPAAVRAAHRRMAAARTAMLAAPTWAAASHHQARWRQAAGVRAGRDQPALAVWDAAEVLPAPASVEAWMAAELAAREDGILPGAVDVWVVESDAAAAGFAPSTLIVLEGAGSEDALGTAEVPAILTERVRARLGLPTDGVRREDLRQRRIQLAASAAQVVVVVAGPEAEAPGGVRWVDPPTARGAGLGSALGRELPSFGPFDGQFLPAAVPGPRSASGFERFGRCPLQYAWRALGIEPAIIPSADADPRSVGLWMHRVLAQTAGQVPPPSISQLEALLQEAMREEPPAASVLPGLLAGRLEGLAADLAEVLAANPPRPEDHLHTEWSWELSWQSQPLTGRMDRVEQRADGTVLVVDYKSGTVDAGKVNPTHIQLALYARAASEALHVPLDSVSAAYWGIRRDSGFAQKILEPPTSARWEEAEAIMAGVVERTAAGALYMFPSAGACRACDWRAACPSSAEALGRQKVAGASGFAALWPGRGEEDGDAPD